MEGNEDGCRLASAGRCENDTAEYIEDGIEFGCGDKLLERIVHDAGHWTPYLWHLLLAMTHVQVLSVPASSPAVWGNVSKSSQEGTSSLVG